MRRKKNILKIKAPPANEVKADDEIEKKVSTEVHVCSMENSSSHLKALLARNKIWKLNQGGKQPLPGCFPVFCSCGRKVGILRAVFAGWGFSSIRAFLSWFVSLLCSCPAWTLLSFLFCPARCETWGGKAEWGVLGSCCLMQGPAAGSPVLNTNRFRLCLKAQSKSSAVSGYLWLRLQGASCLCAYF